MITAKSITIKTTEIHYLESGADNHKDIILLHGMKFNSLTWVETGTLETLEQNGFHAVAVDLPGFGKTKSLDMEKAETLIAIIKELGLIQPVIVSPSMSGGYSLPLIAGQKVPLRAFVAVAPTNIPDYADTLKGNPLPALGIWGSNDTIVPPANADILCSSMPNAKKVIIENGGHPTYLTETTGFHKHLIDFLATV